MKLEKMPLNVLVNLDFSVFKNKEIAKNAIINVKIAKIRKKIVYNAQILAEILIIIVIVKQDSWKILYNQIKFAYNVLTNAKPAQNKSKIASNAAQN